MFTKEELELLTEVELSLLKPATIDVSPKVHNETVKSLLKRIVHERLLNRQIESFNCKTTEVDQ